MLKRLTAAASRRRAARERPAIEAKAVEILRVRALNPDDMTRSAVRRFSTDSLLWMIRKHEPDWKPSGRNH